ncbi:relaxin-3 receptor 1 [Corythoichthys intestinalis]|uniref:relaxin-3 receptor 1 n=1 Tax=Corythoichthys intestinalis TaxID=161448 RepID=UPI0025A54FC7|nr:relaxin-3 receptor 1 [Corythoichthys intestinalis]XP_061811307.1 relaxin-3 receptor 1-like [Nerophis lumbriciformis]
MEVTLNQSEALNRSAHGEETFEGGADGSPFLRILISVVYSVVCAVGLVGNLLVFYLMRLRQGRKKSAINFFIINLAVTDFQFVLTLPFWAVDTALDFSWPFGDTMCKVVLSLTVMNMYASVFFLTAMSVTRYLSVTSALKRSAHRWSRCVKWVCASLWVAATVATAPTAVFSAVTVVAGEKLCLLKFPEGHDWLALYHIQKILVAFIIPLLIVSVNYLMLLRFIKRKSMCVNSRQKRSKVTKSVAIVVLSFFCCWMPNHAITFWGVLVKFNAANWNWSYYMVHAYVFPITVCLAHANSCLNPVLYCLMRPEIRKMLSALFWRAPTPCTGSKDACKAHSDTPGHIQAVRTTANVDFTLSVVGN